MEQKKNTTKNIILILLILIILASSGIGIFAWAKYQTTVTGVGTATVAKWSFKLVDGITETTDVIDFAITRTDANESVVAGKLAPGTSGKFEIGIDASGTETALEYAIDVTLENAPKNMKFYSDEGRTEELTIVNNIFTEKGYMLLKDVNTIKTEEIYWEWPYETGITEEEIEENDIKDTEDAGKQITMQIAVTGYQVTDEPRLSDFVKVGDYVNYDAASGNGAGKSYTTDSSLTGSTTVSTFSSSDTMKWRVLSVDRKTGTVELMSADPTASTVTLSGQTGFLNAETVLNDIGAVYGYGDGAIGGRSMTVEDVEEYSSYDPYTYKNSNSSTGYYGGTREYTSGTFYKEIKDEEGNVTGYETSTTTASSSSPVTMTQTHYAYAAQSYFENTTIYNMIFKKSTDTSTNKPDFWLASRCVRLESSYCGFSVRFVGSGRVAYDYLFRSSDIPYSPAFAVSSVVTLNTNIKTTGQDDSGVWQLKVE